MRSPREPDREAIIPWEEVRAYPRIGAECFDSLYFGININLLKRAEIIETAKKCNPNINIYQMEIDPKAFRLIGKQI